MTPEDIDTLDQLLAASHIGPQWVRPKPDDPQDRWEIGEQLEDDPPHITVHDFGGEALARLVAGLLTAAPELLTLARLGLDPGADVVIARLTAERDEARAELARVTAHYAICHKQRLEAMDAACVKGIALDEARTERDAARAEVEELRQQCHIECRARDQAVAAKAALIDAIRERDDRLAKIVAYASQWQDCTYCEAYAVGGDALPPHDDECPLAGWKRWEAP